MCFAILRHLLQFFGGSGKGKWKNVLKALGEVECEEWTAEECIPRGSGEEEKESRGEWEKAKFGGKERKKLEKRKKEKEKENKTAFEAE